MKILNSLFEIWEQKFGLEDIYKQIERCGRICYASEPIEGRAVDFVQRMINSKHLSVLEHGTVYLSIPVEINEIGGYMTYDAEDEDFSHAIGDRYINNPYSKTSYFKDSTKLYMAVTTNYRVLVENCWLSDLKFLSEPTKAHDKRVTVKFVTNIGVSREFNRHRVHSISEQSTRYCNYSKDKFGNAISINLPTWLSNVSSGECSLDIRSIIESFLHTLKGTFQVNWEKMDYWLLANLVSEHCYLKMIELGSSPQEARSVLPLDTNTELVHTAFVSDWLRFFDLRAVGTTGAPHPDAKAIALPLINEFERLGYISQGMYMDRQ